jgi:hypothetical protein
VRGGKELAEISVGSELLSQISARLSRTSLKWKIKRRSK